MANPANPHPILNPRQGTQGTQGTQKSPVSFADQLAAYNLTPVIIAGQLAPKLASMAILWIGQRIFTKVFGKKGKR